MSTRITPPPDRFSIERTGAPDRLAPAIAVPAAPETAPDREGVMSPAPTPMPVGASPNGQRATRNDRSG